MDFFGIGAEEILLILLVALLLWGPGRLVEIARTMGKTVRAFRKATSDLTSQVVKELDLENELEKTKVKAQLAPPLPENTATPPAPPEINGKTG